jgi:Family of unknown function (DUF5681)
MAENAVTKQRRRGRGRPFEPGKSGNPAGKRKGTRHQITMLAEQLLDNEAEGLIRKAIDLGLSGDVAALRLLLDRILPPRRDRPVGFTLPAIAAPRDLVAAQAAILSAVADGSLTPSEVGEFGKLFENYAKTLEVADFEERLAKLENGQP